MKKVLLTAALLGCLASQSFAEVVNDTIVIEDVKKVKIETRDTVQRIVISGSKDDSQFHYVQRIAIPDTSAVRRTIKSVKDFNKIQVKNDGKPTKWETSAHFNLGLCTMLDAPDGYDFKLWPSWEVGFNFLADWRPYGKKNVWSIGLAFDWRTYRMDKDSHWEKTGDVMALAPNPANIDAKRTSLNVFSLGIPVMYTHYFDNDAKWGITLGGIVNFNTGSHANQRYEIDDYHYDVKLKSIGQQVVTVDGLAIVRIPSFPDLYCKYSPMKYFKDGRGPKMHQISFGFYW